MVKTLFKIFFNPFSYFIEDTYSFFIKKSIKKAIAIH